MSEENKQSEHPAANAPQESGTPLPPPTPGAQPVAPSAPQQPAPQQSPVQQPALQQAPAQQPNAVQPQAQGDPQQQQAPQPPEQSAQQPNQNQQQPTFRENGAFSFFATPSDPDDDPTPMSVGFKIGWFVLGLIGGMLGLFMAWLSTSTLSAKRRRPGAHLDLGRLRSSGSRLLHHRFERWHVPWHAYWRHCSPRR